MGRLTRIRKLEKDMRAEIVLQEEQGHYDTHGPHGYSGINEDNYASHTHYIVDRPRISDPDTVKIETAKKELKEIIDESRWWNILTRLYARSALKIKIMPYRGEISDTIVSVG